MTVENPHAGQGAVVLDIGDDIGAVVVEMPAGTIGQEVEIRPVDRPRPHHLPHVAVVDRPLPNGDSMPSLVFGEVVEGAYELCHKGSEEAVLAVIVRGGAVTEATWPV